MSDDEQNDFRDLVNFLVPQTRLDIRRAALGYILEQSAKLDGTASTLFLRDDSLLGKALMTLCLATISDRGQCLAALTNFSSGSAEVANRVLSEKEIVWKSWESCLSEQPWANYGARLMSNLSRHFPDKALTVLEEHEPKLAERITELLATSPKESCANFLGYFLVNLTTLPRIRKQLVEDGILSKMYPVLSQSDDPLRREVIADILRNLCFEDSLHHLLLDTSDAFLVALLSPLADSGDNLDDDEIQQLPLSLQYYEGTREESPHVRQKLIEGLYQLCATKHGRCTLRSKGVYALMRELDRATGEKVDPTAPPPKMRAPTLLAQEEHTLHALIGMLIRYEEDLAIDPAVKSLRELE